MRLLASITLCAAVHALAPLRATRRSVPPRPRLSPSPRPAISAPVRTTNGANSVASAVGGPRRRARGVLRSSPDDVDDEVVSSDADFGGAVINAVTAVLGVAVAISTVCNLAGYGFMQTEEGAYFGTIQQTRMRYQLDQEVAGEVIHARAVGLSDP